ncbi:hypothetical protein THAOC_37179, partial [Thalassiosira oceanica]
MVHRWLFEADGGHGPTQWTRRCVEGTRLYRIDPVGAPNTTRVSERVAQDKSSSGVPSPPKRIKPTQIVLDSRKDDMQGATLNDDSGTQANPLQRTMRPCSALLGAFSLQRLVSPWCGARMTLSSELSPCPCRSSHTYWTGHGHHAQLPLSVSATVVVLIERRHNRRTPQLFCTLSKLLYGAEISQHFDLLIHLPA